MGLRLFGQESGSCFFITTSFYNRQNLCDVPGVYEELVRCLKVCIDKTNSKLIGYVFMPSHLHLLLAIDGEFLAGFMRDLKKYTAQKTLKHLQLDGKLWQERYDRVAITSVGVLRTKLNYIHYNPVKAGLVDKPENWYWSSAGQYLSNRISSIRVWTDW